MATKVSPVQLAKQLGVRPQKLYGLVKQGRVNKYQGEKSWLVDPDEVKRVLDGAVIDVKHHVNSFVEVKEYPYKEGDILAWEWKPGGGQRFARIEHIDPATEEGALVELVMLDNGDKATFSADRVTSGIKAKRFQLAEPDLILQRIIAHYLTTGNEEYANALEKVRTKHNGGVK